MPENLIAGLFPGVKSHGFLLVPSVLALGMALCDLRSRRIPNLLTWFTALAGLGFQWGAHSWPGLGQGFLGMALGLALLLPFYLGGGMGAGDVKALAALGTWLGPRGTLFLFVYMGLAGLPLILLFLWRRGELGPFCRKLAALLMSRLLLRGAGPAPAPTPGSGEGIPYAVALALGMLALCCRGL